MEPEPEEVDTKREDDEGEESGCKVTCELFLKQRQFHGQGGDGYDREATTVVEKIPEIHRDGSTDSEECEQTDILCTHDERQCDARRNKPYPPLLRERLMSIRVEFDVHPNRHGNTKYQRRIQKNQSLLCQLRIVYPCQG